MRVAIMRHGEAADGPDRERPLTPAGEEAARRGGVWLRAAGFTPQRIVASPARRTATTAALVGKTFPAVEVEIEERLYGAGAATLAALIDRCTVPTLFVGHNPGVSELVTMRLQRPVRMRPADIHVLGPPHRSFAA